VSASNRTATISRTTSESSIELTLDLDGTGQSTIDTGVPFYDHMLTAFARHSLCDLTIKATGDLHIDIHHTVEDTAISLGQAIKQALGNKAGITRYGDAHVPLDDALARAVIDISGRPYLVHTGEPEGFALHKIGGHFTGSLVRHVFEAIALNADLTVRRDHEFHVEKVVVDHERLKRTRDGRFVERRPREERVDVVGYVERDDVARLHSSFAKHRANSCRCVGKELVRHSALGGENRRRRRR
jgi:imidazoleglycerol-phosphate dehydratase